MEGGGGVYDAGGAGGGIGVPVGRLHGVVCFAHHGGKAGEIQLVLVIHIPEGALAGFVQLAPDRAYVDAVVH